MPERTIYSCYNQTSRHLAHSLPLVQLTCPLPLHPKNPVRNLILPIHNSKTDCSRVDPQLLQSIKVVGQRDQRRPIHPPRQLVVITILKMQFQVEGVLEIVAIQPAAMGDDFVAHVDLESAYILRVGEVGANGVPVGFAGGDLGDVDDADVGFAVGSAPIRWCFAGEIAGPARGEAC